MKTLFVTFEFQDIIHGGLGRVINGLVPELCKIVELEILFLHEKGNKIIRCINNEGDISYEELMSAPGTVVSYIESKKFDVVHFFCVNLTFPLLMKSLKKKLPNIKLILSMHNIFEYEKDIRSCSDGILLSERKMIELCDSIHLLNPASELYFKKSYPDTHKKIFIITNGVSSRNVIDRNFDAVSFPNFNFPSGKKIIFTSTRWAPGKGLEYLLEAATEILNARNDVCFVLAGRKENSWEFDGNEYVKKIDAKINEIGRDIYSVGWINDAQRDLIFSLAHLYVMPSELEYFSYGSLEPLLVGTPLIQSRIDCLLDVFESNLDCLFYSPTNTAELIEKIIFGLDNPKIMEEMARNGRIKVNNFCGWKEIATLYHKMYVEISGL